MIIASILPSTLILGATSRSHSQQEVKTTGAPQSAQLGTAWTGEELSALSLETTVAKFPKM